MRKQFSDAMVARAATNRLVFMTCDLGFMALEPLQLALGKYFINLESAVGNRMMSGIGSCDGLRGGLDWVK